MTPTRAPIDRTVRNLIAEVCGIDAETLDPKRSLIEFGMDSARVIDLIVMLEEAFSIKIPDDGARDMRTLSDVVAYVERCIGAS